MSQNLEKKNKELESEINRLRNLISVYKEMVKVQKDHIDLIDKNNSFNHLKIVQ